jgi:hypothetical protein
MAITVFNDGKGLFHQGSGGKGIAQADVCLSPPPPPAGPPPIPYVNMLSASDLSEGSKTVTIDGNPTALEDQSYVSTSTGDEAGTQGGNVITHKTKGKGYFTLWSFNVKIEDKGVCRHGDPMGQNSASSPPGCVDMRAIVSFVLALPITEFEPCNEPYSRSKLGLGSTTDKQKAHVRGGPCWECKRDLHKSDWTSITLSSGKVVAKTSEYTGGYDDPKYFTPDHQPPLNVAWNLGGCHMKPSPKAFQDWANSTQAVKPHCRFHSSSQGGTVRALNSLDAITAVIP